MLKRLWGKEVLNRALKDFRDFIQLSEIIVSRIIWTFNLANETIRYIKLKG